MSLLYQAMQRVARDYDGNRVGTGILFGKVRAVRPLKIEIDGKLTLEEEFLTLVEHLTDYEIPFEILRSAEATHAEKRPTVLNKIAKVAGFFVQHEGRHDVQVEPGTLSNFHGEGTLKLYNHLREGDVVILARMAGGHLYIVLDRVATAEK